MLEKNEITSDNAHNEITLSSSLSDTIAKSYLAQIMLPNNPTTVKTNVYSPICSGEYRRVIIGEAIIIIS